MMKINTSNSFLCIILFSIVSIIGAFVVKDHNYKQQMVEIVRLQKEDSRCLKGLINSMNIKILADKDFKDDLLASIDNHNLKMQHEIEAANAKLQSDIDLLSLWASIITIVFLVFSFYSIFKTDEMLSKAQMALENLTKKENDANNILNNINSQAEQVLQGISQRVSNIDTRVVQLNEKLSAIQLQTESTGGSSNDVSHDESESESMNDIQATSSTDAVVPQPPLQQPSVDIEPSETDIPSANQ